MSNNIKGNYIRHTQEALEEIFDGLKTHDKALLSIAIDELVGFTCQLGHNDNYQNECILVDYEVPDTLDKNYVHAWKCAKVVEAYLNHQMYDKYGDLWHDMVEELIMALLKLI